MLNSPELGDGTRHLGVLGELAAREHAQHEPFELEQHDRSRGHLLVAGVLGCDDTLGLQAQAPVEGQRPLEVLYRKCDDVNSRLHSPSF